MSNYYKPQIPLVKGNDFIYPLTTADQVLLEDGSRLNAKVVMAALDDVEDGEDYNPDEVLVNAESLGGIPANSYMLKTDTAANSTKLDGKPASDYLLKTDEIENSAKLGGKPASDYSLRADTVFSVNGNLPDNNGNVALTASDVGARPSTWMPTASDVGALASSYKNDIDSMIKRWNVNTNVNVCENIDNPAQTGFFHCGQVTTGTKPSTHGELLHITETPNYSEHQLFFTSTDDQIWHRHRNNNNAPNSAAWSAWKRIMAVQDIYPVGSIYMSVNSTSPASLFGGTWEQLKDRFLLGAGNSYSINATGGATTHTHTTGNHTLTINEMPYHRHETQFAWDANHSESYIGTANGLTTDSYKWVSNNYLLDMSTATGTGGSQPHNHGNTGSSSNLPPYLAVYMWKRVS